MLLGLAGSLEQLGRLQHINRAARRIGSHIADEALLPHPLLEALDDHRPVAHGRTQLRESQDGAEPQKQHEDEHRACGERLKETNDEIDEIR